MNQEADKVQEKPVLSPEGFQHLLAAAYLLQVHNDRRPSIRPVQHVSANQVSSFAAGTIVQRRTPSMMIRERPLQVGRPDAVPKRVPFSEPAVLHRFSASLRKPMSWRTVEALAIAIVFCMTMGMSIHRLSAVSSPTSLASGMLKEQNDFQPTRPTEKSLAVPQPIEPRESSQVQREARAITLPKTSLSVTKNALSIDLVSLAFR